ncbi:MAG: vitamin K epoxide reductase family protein [Chloroflexi bacterium]|nr:vitamin K epoxide reductase family protein [Chloroflexota bacterium]
MTTKNTTEHNPVVLQPRLNLTLRGVSLFLVAIGIAISGYLSIVKLTDSSQICIETGPFNCDVVQSSVYAEFMGIPIAYLGLATYLTLGFLIAFENRIGLLKDYGVTLTFGIALFAFMYSMWLVYLQVFRLEALCMWCLAHEIVMTLLFIVTALRLRKVLTA